MHILATNPADYPEKWEDLRDLFKNAHHAVNEYRPYQAREQLITLLESQVARARAEIRGVEDMRKKVNNVLRSIADGVERDGLAKEVDSLPEKTEEERKADAQLDEERRVWEELELEIG